MQKAKVFCIIAVIEGKEKGKSMVDFNSNIEPKGLPQLDKDYWQAQKKTEKTEINLFDSIIETNFDVSKLKNTSVFTSDKK